MTLDTDSRALDAAYRPFPTFERWQAGARVESQRWLRYLRQLQSAREVSATVLARAAEVAKRAAAFDTGAIENLYETDRGFTYSVALETAAWEIGLLEKGEKVRSLFEAQMQAYDFVLDLATRAEPVSEAALRRLHEVICAAQDTYQVMTSVGPQNQPLPKGQYKSLPNHVRTREGQDHSYAPVDMTPPEMHRLVQELRSEAFLQAHPVTQAAYAHYCFVVIHPFADGNGRVARALASLYTYRAASVPIIVLSEYKTEYLDCLADADGGRWQRFVDFLLGRALDTMQLVEESLASAETPSREEALLALERLYFTQSGFSPDEADNLGRAFVSLFATELQEQLAPHPAYDAQVRSLEIGLEPVTLALYRNSPDTAAAGSPTPPATYRRLLNGKDIFTSIVLKATPPEQGAVRQAFYLFIPKAENMEEDLVLVPNSGKPITARLDELHPKVSGFLRLRIKMNAERVAAELISDLTTQMRNGSK